MGRAISVGILCIMAFFLQAYCLPQIGIPSRRFDIESFGANGNRTSDSTQALLNAWEAACKVERATVVVPSEKTFLIKPCTFQGPCKANLSLKIDGTLMAPESPRNWSTTNSWLTFTNLEHFTLRGEGTISARGQQWWKTFCSIVNNKRTCSTDMPTSVHFEDCGYIKVKGLEIKDSAHFHLQFLHCHHVTAVSLYIRAPSNSPQTDGIHLEHTQNGRIINSTIGTGDDCVSVGHGCANVSISGLTCGPGHGISVGSLGKWSSSAQVHNIKVDGAKLTGTQNGLRIKTWQGGRGWARNIMFKNIEMINVSNPIVINQYYCDSPLPCQNHTSAVEISDIIFENIVGTSQTEVAVKLVCSTHVPCKRILLSHISLKPSESERKVSSYCHNALGEAEGDIAPPSCLT